MWEYQRSGIFLSKILLTYGFKGVAMGQKDKNFDLQKIKELIALMKTHNLVEIEVMHGDDKILLKRVGAQTEVLSEPVVEQHPAGRGSSDEGLEVIKSPTPGTFYAAPSQDSEPYVEIGSEVTPETTVCIIDMMKVINEIKAETTGTIAEILAKSGQAIEYGQPLFKVRPEQAQKK